jgi:glutamate-ammonia-ligase adenylyltransferase
VPTPSDLFLSPDLSEEDAREYLRALGFHDAEATDRHLQAMASDVVIREAMGRIAADLLPALLESPDPDAAVVGLSHYLAARTGRGMFLDYLAEDPRAMHVLACVFGSSPALSEILVRNPEYFHWLVSQVERSAPEREDLEEEIEMILANLDEPIEALEALKRWKRRELLRIGTRDLLRRETVPAACAQLSDLATVAVDRALAIVTTRMLRAESRAAAPGKLAVIALGALGGRELGYSSDLRLLYVFDTSDDSASGKQFFERLGDDLTKALDGGDETDTAYRVFASAYSLDEYCRMLSSSGGIAERLALIQGRPVAGDRELGRRFIERVRPFVFDEGGEPDSDNHRASIHAQLLEWDKAEVTGARLVERMTQLFQLAHGARHPTVCQTGTLAALDALASASLVSENLRRELAQAYVFLRAVEHRLQLVPESQTGLGSSEDLEKQVIVCARRVAELSVVMADQLKNQG